MLNHCRVLLLLSQLLFAGASVSSAQTISPRLLAEQAVYSVFQDSDGFMWFATEAGVYRYDGSQQKAFSIKDGLSGNEVFNIHEDSKGRIWFLTYSGQPNYYLDGKIHNARSDQMISELDNPSYLNGFVEDSHQQLWFSSYNYGIQKVDTNNEVHKICYNRRDGDEAKYRGLWLDNQNNVWGLIKPIKKNASEVGLYINFSCGDTIVSHYRNKTRIEARIQKTQGGTVIRVSDQGLLSLKDGEETLILEFGKDIPDVRINDIFINDLDQLWLGSNDGLIILERTDGKWVNPTYLLKGNEVSKTFQDHELNYWVSTIGNGVYFFPFYKGDYRFNSASVDLNDYSIHALMKQNGQLWFGAENLAFGYLDKTAVNLYKLKQELKAGGNVVTNLKPISDGSVWVLTNGDIAGVYRDGAVQEIGHGVSDVEEDQVGNMHLSTAGVNGRVVTRTKEWWLHNADSLVQILKRDPQTYSSIKSLAIDSQQRLLIGTKGGVLIDKGVAFGAWQESVFGHKQITDIQVSSVDQSVWVATWGWGIYRVTEDSVKNLSDKDGLLSNNCESIYIDDVNDVWVLSKEGLNFVLGGDDESGIYWLDHESVLNCKRINAVYYSDEELVLGTDSGLKTLYSFKAKLDKGHPLIRIDHVSVDDSLIHRPIDPVLIPSARASFQVNFRAVSYTGMDQILYKCKLSGIDTIWRETKDAFMRYSEIPPGSYRFQVMARNASGLWSKEAAFVDLEVPKPSSLSQYWWSIPLVVVPVLVLLVLRFISARIRSAKTDRPFHSKQQKTRHFKVNNALHSVKEEDILWIEAAGDYVKVHTSSQKLVVHQTMKGMERLLTQSDFLRVHRSFIVRVDKIDRFQGKKALVIQNTTIPISATYKSKLAEIRASLQQPEG